MFEYYTFKKNDKYKLYDKDELYNRMELSKKIFIEKGYWYTILFFYILYFYNLNSLTVKYDYRAHDVLKIGTFIIGLVVLFSLIQILKRSMLLYKLKLDLNSKEDSDGIRVLYSSYLAKKWYILINQIILMATIVYCYYYYGYSEINLNLFLNVLIILFLVNIIRLLITLGINKFSMLMVKATLEEFVSEFEENGFDSVNLDEKFDSQQGIEFLSGTRFVAITKQLKSLLDKLEEATNKEKNSTLGKTQLVTNLSHDLKTPLTSIINSIYILKNEELNQDEEKEQINILKEKSERLNTLIHNLNEVLNSKDEEIVLNKETIDLNQLLEETINNFSYKFNNLNLDVRLKCSEENVKVYMDKDKLIRVFENLLGNIAKYSLEDTRVYIETVKDEDNTVITFKNISKHQLEVDKNSLGNRFVKGDKSRHDDGYGLGLSIVKNLIKVQGGKVDINSQGDLFKVSINIKII
ncbi:sensor histidine kinase [Romboutsia sp.]|uniref:sensor histidine kinase n=1 Tax=Romboutsia sp. TaxID=1965302 RepID=UPI003F404252